MAKNVVVSCDGTANEFAADQTNVLKWFRALDKNPSLQAAFYHPGVRTLDRRDEANGPYALSDLSFTLLRCFFQIPLTNHMA